MHFWQLVLYVIPFSNLVVISMRNYDFYNLIQKAAIKTTTNERPKINILVTNYRSIGKPITTKSSSIFAGILHDFVRYLYAAKSLKPLEF